MKALLTACMAALQICAAGAAGAAAQAIFKQTDETGRTIFTDRPDPAARIVAMYAAAQYSGSSAQPDDPPVFRPVAAAAKPTDVETALQHMAPISSARAAIIDANEAARRGRQEQRTLTQGAEILRAELTVNREAFAQIRARPAADRPSHRLAPVSIIGFQTVGYMLLALALALGYVAFNARRLIDMSGSRVQH